MKILAFAGSLRKDSVNKKLVKIASEGARAAGAEVTIIDLKDYPLPLYDQEIEESTGIPENAKKLKKLLLESDGFLIASPEYNSSISAVLKNMIDWASRKNEPNEGDLICFKGKFISLMSASPSFLGGLRGLVHVRQIFTNIFSIVLPNQKCISNAFEAFDDKGNLTDEKKHQAVKELGKELALFIKQFKKNS